MAGDGEQYAVVCCYSSFKTQAGQAGGLVQYAVVLCALVALRRECSAALRH